MHTDGKNPLPVARTDAVQSLPRLSGVALLWLGAFAVRLWMRDDRRLWWELKAFCGRGADSAERSGGQSGPSRAGHLRPLRRAGTDAGDAGAATDGFDWTVAESGVYPSRWAGHEPGESPAGGFISHVASAGAD